MTKHLKRIASKLPIGAQQVLKRIYFGWQIKKGDFKTNEKEYDRLEEWVGQNDWVLDIGANIGHYSAKLSRLVGENGRVIAFEPVPRTFELLAANVVRFPLGNVTLLNVAVTDKTNIVGMSIPKFDTGLDNYYMAQLTNEKADVSMLGLAVDCLDIPNPVKLAKLDVEGHEFIALKGMENLIKRDHPTLIVEGGDSDVEQYLTSHGYSFEHIENSSNRIYTYSAA